MAMSQEKTEKHTNEQMDAIKYIYLLVLWSLIKVQVVNVIETNFIFVKTVFI